MVRIRPLLAFVLAVASPLTVVAQERIALFTKFDRQAALVEIDATVSGFGTILSATTLNDVSTNFFSPPVALAGGRYLAWLASSPTQPWGDLVVFDRRTKHRFYAGVPNPVGPSLVNYATDLIADRTSPRVFYRVGGLHYSAVWSLDARQPTPRRLFAMTTEGFVDAFLLADDAEELFLTVTFASGPPYRQIVVIDANDGHELRRLPVDGFLEGIRGVDPAGTVLLTSVGSWLSRRDARTGDAPSIRTSDVASLGGVDAERNRLLVLGYRDLRALDTNTLAEQWRTPVGTVSDPNRLQITRVVTPGRWMTGAYIARAETRVIQPPVYYFPGEYTCNAINVDVFDPDGTLRATVDVMERLRIPGGNGACSAQPVLVRSPFAPAALAAAIDGHTVALSWRDPGDTEGFVIEYGFAPGQRADVLHLPPGTTRFTIPNVPAGTYFVRARAVNDVGSSPASNEVRVVVP